MDDDDRDPILVPDIPIVDNPDQLDVDMSSLKLRMMNRNIVGIGELLDEFVQRLRSGRYNDILLK